MHADCFQASGAFLESFSVQKSITCEIEGTCNSNHGAKSEWISQPGSSQYPLSFSSPPSARRANVISSSLVNAVHWERGREKKNRSSPPAVFHPFGFHLRSSSPFHPLFLLVIFRCESAAVCGTSKRERIGIVMFPLVFLSNAKARPSDPRNLLVSRRPSPLLSREHSLHDLPLPALADS